MKNLTRREALKSIGAGASVLGLMNFSAIAHADEPVYWNPEMTLNAAGIQTSPYPSITVTGLIGGDLPMVVEPRITFSGLPAAVYECFAMLTENDTNAYIATKDRLFNTVFIEFRQGDRVRSYARRQLSGNVSWICDAFESLAALNLTPTKSSTAKYHFIAGIAPNGEIEAGNFSNFKGFDLYMNP